MTNSLMTWPEGDPNVVQPSVLRDTGRAAWLGLFRLSVLLELHKLREEACSVNICIARCRGLLGKG